jgi:bisphosphoglycerate-independent phosphoglycerate mutase (AlkP superfamily)
MKPDTEARPLLLMILDGWGYRSEVQDNAIALGNTPCWDRLWDSDPHILIETSGESVGLPPGQMGNSEVGHMNIGAGRIVYQDFTRIAQAIRDGSFHQNPVLRSAIDTTRDSGGTLHIMGLLSPGGVQAACTATTISSWKPSNWRHVAAQRSPSTPFLMAATHLPGARGLPLKGCSRRWMVSPTLPSAP